MKVGRLRPISFLSRNDRLSALTPAFGFETRWLPHRYSEVRLFHVEFRLALEGKLPFPFGLPSLRNWRN